MTYRPRRPRPRRRKRTITGPRWCSRSWNRLSSRKLQAETQEAYVQAIPELKLLDAQVAEQVKLFMPEIRHNVLMILAGKKASELGTPQGMQGSRPIILLNQRPHALARTAGSGTRKHNQARSGSTGAGSVFHR